MPERQSSPGEVTARPEPDVTENGNGTGPEARSSAPSGGPERVADQVVEQVAAAPDATEPGPVEPAADAPTGDEPVLDGAAAAEIGKGGAKPDGEAQATPAGRSSPAPRPSPGPRPRPESSAANDSESPTVRTAVGEPAADESPTVRTANGSVEQTTAVVRVPSAAPASGAPASAPPSWFSSVDADATQVIPRTPAAAPVDPAPAAPEPVTERIPVTAPAPTPPPHVPQRGATYDDGRPPRKRRSLLVLTGVVVALVLLYVGDLVLSSGSVPRGVAVAGVSVGGLGLDEAEQRLRGEIEPRTTQPIQVTVGEASGEIDPATAGLAIDWTGTLDRAGSRPLNPITRITSFFTERDVGVATTTDPAALTAALEELSPAVDRAPVEGSVQFQDIRPMPVDPVPGQQLDVPAAAEVMERDWAIGRPVALPLTELPPTTTPDDVAAAIEQVARPAMSGPVTVTGENGAEGTITPEVIATALLFRADAGALVPEINQTAIEDALKPQLADSERPGRDATLDFSSGSPVVVPSQDGRGVDYQASLADLLTVLSGTGPRQITAIYADQPAELTTEELNGLGITGVIGEFSTGGFAADSGRNIQRAAEQINGMVVQPGETFSLNAATAPRNASNGYVEAGIISDGHASRGIGGGVSQVATTLYNAAYFAGMVDVAHKEHSFYISRYPAGREATVFEGAIDLKWRNDNPTGVMIQTVWTPNSLTVRLYGTKRYEVTSTPGPRTKPTQPNTITIPAGESCSPSQGAPGFTVTDTRTLREVSTGQVRTETRTVRYNPSPIVVCEG
jgi:vancomycin resistance protein YoaR